MKTNDILASEATLRDYIALSALQAFLSDNVGMTTLQKTGVDFIAATVADAYFFADAMLAERLK